MTVKKITRPNPACSTGFGSLETVAGKRGTAVTHKSRLAALGMAVALGGALVVGCREAQAGAAAPACIKRVVGQQLTSHLDSVFIYNDCGKPMRVRVIVNRGRDSGCITLTNRQSTRVDLAGIFGATLGRDLGSFGVSYRKTVTC